MIDWELFKETKIAIRCTANKEQFFKDCLNHDIHIYMGEHAKKRDIFYCILFGRTLFASGRYELWSCEEWQTKPGVLFDINGLPIVEYNKER